MDENLIRLMPDKIKLELIQRRIQEIQSKKAEVPLDSDPVRWITSNFYIPELRGPLQLAPYQRAALREALRRDKDGKFAYSTVIWSDIKKSIKSTIAAAVGLWRGYSLNWGSIIMVANDLKQADSRVGFYMRRAIELNPLMKATCKIRNYEIELPNRTKIESVAIDPTGEAGSNADFIVFSELWGAHQEAQKRMWVEMTLPPNKFGYSQRWVETYAGYSGESPLLETLYEQGVRHGHILDLGIPGLEVYANEAARLFVLWNTTPRLSWQGQDYYAQEAAILPPHEFQRVHRNQWVTSSQTFVPMEWWKACKSEEMPPLQPTEPLIFAIDAGVVSDCFAIVGVSRRGTKLYVRYARKWQPEAGKKLDFSGPEAEIRRLSQEYNVLEWAYDEYQLHDLCKRLARDGMGWFNPFSQSSQRMVADKNLYDLIRERSIFHPGLTDLDEHIQNANAEVKGEKMRLVKRSEFMKIDLAVALSMASYEAVRLNIGFME